MKMGCVLYLEIVWHWCMNTVHFSIRVVLGMRFRQRRSDTSDVIYMHQHVILIAKLIANLLHSISPTAIYGLGSLGFGGIFNHAEAVYLVEIDHRCSSSS